MTPPCYTFSAAELEDRVQLDVTGRQRKMPYADDGPSVAKSKSKSTGSSETSRSDVHADGGTDTGPGPDNPSHRPYGVDLRACALLSSMVQYTCAVAHPEQRDSPVRCWPVQRLFRRCQDRSGSFMVETTAWEGSGAARSSGGGGGVVNLPASSSS